MFETLVLVAILAQTSSSSSLSPLYSNTPAIIQTPAGPTLAWDYQDADLTGKTDEGVTFTVTEFRVLTPGVAERVVGLPVLNTFTGGKTYGTPVTGLAGKYEVRACAPTLPTPCSDPAVFDYQPTAEKLAIGQRAQVWSNTDPATGIGAAVRSGPGVYSSTDPVQPPGAKGTVLDGPVEAAFGPGQPSLAWYRIDYDIDPDGWSNAPNIGACTTACGTTTNQPPTVSLASVPTSGPAPLSVNLTATASDPDGTVQLVEFYRNGVKVTEDVTAPFTASLTALAAGTHVLTAKATDNVGAATTSAAVNVTAATQPTPTGPAVSGPANALTGQTITINWSCGTNCGTIGKDWIGLFPKGATAEGSNLWWPGVYNVVPGSGTYKYVVAVGAGDYELKYCLNDGYVCPVSAAIRIDSPPNAPPTVSLTSTPASGTAPLSIALAATAADSDGTVKLVEFFRNGTKVTEDITAPFTATFTGLLAGTHAITAKATDDDGASTTSASVTVTVTSPTNAVPTIVVTATPASGTAPFDTALSATAIDVDGTIKLVEFFKDGVKLGDDATAPYTASMTALPVGIYQVTAKATDDKDGSATSTPVTVSVTATPADPCLASPPTLTVSTWPTFNQGTRPNFTARSPRYNSTSQISVTFNFVGSRAVSATIDDGTCKFTRVR